MKADAIISDVFEQEPALDDPGEVERHFEDCLSSFMFDYVVVEVIGNGYS